MHRILLIEDEKQVAAFVRQGLEEEGYAVEWEATGRAGERRAVAEPFDLLLLDLRLPDVYGVEVCKEVRRHAPALPVLMLTALEPTDRVHTDGRLSLDPAARRCTWSGQRLDLSATEFDLLAYFLARKRQVLTRERIHRSVWGHDFNRGANLIDVYVGYVRRKLAAVGCAARIETVRGVGYRYCPSEETEAPGDG